MPADGARGVEQLCPRDYSVQNEIDSGPPVSSAPAGGEGFSSPIRVPPGTMLSVETSTVSEQSSGMLMSGSEAAAPVAANPEETTIRPRPSPIASPDSPAAGPDSHAVGQGCRANVVPLGGSVGCVDDSGTLVVAPPTEDHDDAATSRHETIDGSSKPGLDNRKDSSLVEKEEFDADVLHAEGRSEIPSHQSFAAPCSETGSDGESLGQQRHAERFELASGETGELGTHVEVLAARGDGVTAAENEIERVLCAEAHSELGAASCAAEAALPNHPQDDRSVGAESPSPVGREQVESTEEHDEGYDEFDEEDGHREGNRRAETDEESNVGGEGYSEGEDAFENDGGETDSDEAEIGRGADETEGEYSTGEDDFEEDEEDPQADHDVITVGSLDYDDDHKTGVVDQSRHVHDGGVDDENSDDAYEEDTEDEDADADEDANDETDTNRK